MLKKSVSVVVISFLVLVIVIFASGCTNTSNTKENLPEPTQNVQKEENMSKYLVVTNSTRKFTTVSTVHYQNVSGKIKNTSNKTLGPVYVTAIGYHRDVKYVEEISRNTTKVNCGEDDMLDPGEIGTFTLLLNDRWNDISSSGRIELIPYL